MTAFPPVQRAIKRVLEGRGSLRKTLLIYKKNESEAKAARPLTRPLVAKKGHQGIPWRSKGPPGREALGPSLGV